MLAAWGEWAVVDKVTTGGYLRELMDQQFAEEAKELYDDASCHEEISQVGYITCQVTAIRHQKPSAFNHGARDNYEAYILQCCLALGQPTHPPFCFQVLCSLTLYQQGALVEVMACGDA